MSSLEPFKAIPSRSNRLTKPRISEIHLFQGVVNSAEVAWRARYHHVFQIVLPSKGVRHNMIVLDPHGLESCVLKAVSLSPNTQFRVGTTNPCTDFPANNRNAAEATVKAIAVKKRAP